MCLMPWHLLTAEANLFLSLVELLQEADPQLYTKMGQHAVIPKLTWLLCYNVRIPPLILSYPSHHRILAIVTKIS